MFGESAMSIAFLNPAKEPNNARGTPATPQHPTTINKPPPPHTTSPPRFGAVNPLGL